MLDLKNKVICITGASYGLGLEITKILLSKKAIVHSIARSESPIENSNLFHHRTDLNEGIPDIQDIKFDILIMNVGYNPGRVPYDKLAYNEVERAVRLNILVHLELISRLRHKKIVFINSVVSMVGIPDFSLYCASKAFISNFNEALQREGKDTYIVYPYKINTGFFQQMKDFMTLDKKYLAQIIVRDIEHGVRKRTVPCVFAILTFLQCIIPDCVINFVIKILIKIMIK